MRQVRPVRWAGGAAWIIACLVGIRTSEGSWVQISLDARLARADLVVVGTLGPANPPGQDRVTGSIRIEEVLKGDPSLGTASLQFYRRRVHSAAVVYAPGNAGIWILNRVPGGDAYTADYPGNLQPPEERAAIVRILAAQAAQASAVPERRPPPGAAPAPRKRLDLRAAELRQALPAIEAAFSVRYIATAEVVAAARPVTLAGEFTLEEALAEISRQARVSARLGADGVVAVGPAGEAPPADTLPPGVEERANLVVEGETIVKIVWTNGIPNHPELEIARQRAAIKVVRVARVVRGDAAGADEIRLTDGADALRAGARGTFWLSFQPPAPRGAAAARLLHFRPEAASAPSPAGEGAEGIRGVVIQGWENRMPMVIEPGMPAPEPGSRRHANPVSAGVWVFRGSGYRPSRPLAAERADPRFAGSARSGPDGRYSIALDPGEYTVIAELPDGRRHVSEARVEAGRWLDHPIEDVTIAQ